MAGRVVLAEPHPPQSVALTTTNRYGRRFDGQAGAARNGRGKTSGSCPPVPGRHPLRIAVYPWQKSAIADRSSLRLG